MTDTTRSPIKDRPLRTPGQSLREQRNRLWEDKLEPWAMLALFFTAMAAMEWFRHYLKSPPMPWLFTAVAAAVLVGPAGVFTVETKTWSKPVKGDARIRYDGERLTVGGREPERDARAQALGQARWLARTLEASSGRKLTVQPVVVFPGWFVEADPGSQREVWFMEPKGLPAFLARQRSQPAAEDMKLAACHLSRYIRARAQEAG